MIVFVGWDSFKFFGDLCEMDEIQFVGNFFCNLKTILILQFGVCCCRQYSFRLLTGLFVMVFRIVVVTSNRWDLKFTKDVKKKIGFTNIPSPSLHLNWSCLGLN